MDIGKEYFGAVSTALYRKDCHIAKLPAVGYAQELT
jgi:hypothetical protein